jgi:hypothetical protein
MREDTRKKEFTQWAKSPASFSHIAGVIGA